jgi:SAM-dependent methyltransferase
MSEVAGTTGSAERWGPLWSARAADWSANEEQQLPTYEAALERLHAGPGLRVLEVGCGSGVFLRAAADRGAEVWGLDASEALLELARRRVPEAALRAGDLEHLPYGDDEFDVVAGFNAFFFADDMVAALREARRVTRPGGTVVIQVWGRPERCALTATKPAIAAFLPPPPPGATGVSGSKLYEPGLLEEMASAAGLEPVEAFDVTWAYEYPDADALARGMLSPGGLTVLVDSARHGELRAAIVGALAPYRTGDGGYRLPNEWRILLARA